MNLRHLTLCLLFLFLALGWLGFRTVGTPAAQQSSHEAPAPAAGVIRKEANLVLVDVVVQDKKGNYIRDLESKDFHVFEDDEEQPVTSFSRGSNANAPNAPPQRRYVVLFFDNSTMAPAEQMRAREAAVQFAEKSASSDRLMAVVDFGGSLRIAQNFTADVESLKRVMTGVKFSAVQPNERGQTTYIASLGAPSPVQVRSDLAARSVLLAIRSLSKTLRPVPGRKTVILFSGGFPLTPERESELTATIDAANKANVAIYPVDVRGLQGLGPTPMPDVSDPTRRQPSGFPPGARLGEPLFPHEKALWAFLLGPPEPLSQRPEGGGGAEGRGEGGGGRGGSAPPSGGSTGGAGSTPPGPSPSGPGGNPFGGGRGGLDTNRNNPLGNNQPGYPNYPGRGIIPPLLESVTTNQQVLSALAAGTGGFTIFNTNSFIAGLAKIAKELDEYYVLGYVPPSQFHDGSYHKIRVKVDMKGLKVRSRTGYYDVKSPDLLAGRPEGKILEERAASPQPGNITVFLEAPYFYTSSETARVNLAMEIPADTLNFEKGKGVFHSEVNVLGIAYREDGSVAARFSDTVKLDKEKKEVKEFSKGSFGYQNAFDIAPGKYSLKVVMSTGGQSFGKYDTPLVIEAYNGKQFGLSDVALSDEFHPVSQMLTRLGEALLEERTPLVSQGIQVIPSATNRFKRSRKVGLYVEVYEPLLLNSNPPRVGIIYNVIDRKTNQEVYTSNTILVNSAAQPGNPVIPVAALLPVDKLQAGDYRLEVRARDSVGNASSLRSTNFELN